MGKRRVEAVAKNQNSELICVADNDLMCAKKLAQTLKCDFYSSYEKAIERNEVNAVVVAMPNKYHCEVSEKSLNLGKHVFCEKPLTITPQEAKLLVWTAFKNKVYLKAGSNVRFFPNVLKAKELINCGVLGKLLFARGWIGHEGWNLGQGSWFSNPDIVGGGTLLDNGCHIIDIVRWFIGEIKECIGYCATVLHKLPSALEDNAMGILIGTDGQMATVQSSWTEWDGYFYLEFCGEKGTVCIDSRGSKADTIVKIKNNPPEILDYSKEPKVSFQKEIDDFVSCMMEKRQPLPSGYDGMRTIQIINALYKSAKSGQRICVFGDEDQNFKRLIEGHGKSF